MSAYLVLTRIAQIFNRLFCIAKETILQKPVGLPKTSRYTYYLYRENITIHTNAIRHSSNLSVIQLRMCRDLSLTISNNVQIITKLYAYILRDELQSLMSL